MKTNRWIAALLCLSLLTCLCLSSCRETDRGEVHTHTFSEAWTGNATEHWHAATCGHTDQVSGKAPHTFEGDTCTVCGCRAATAEGLVFRRALDGYHVVGLADFAGGALVIPPEYNGQPVTYLVDSAFAGCTGMTSVVIPESVTGIGTDVFNDCPNLVSFEVREGNPVYYSAGNCLISRADGNALVIAGCRTSVIPTDGSIRGILDGAFRGCTALTSVTIPASVVSVGYGVFARCPALTSITVEEGNPYFRGAGNCLIKTTDGTLIAGCRTSVIPDDGSVTAIDIQAFAGCDTLQTIHIPASVTDIASDAFAGCGGLTAITVDAGNPRFEARGNNLIKLEHGTLFRACRNSTIPTDEDIREIGAEAFSGCDSLSSIEIPDQIGSIGTRAFADCRNLTAVVFADSTAKIETEAFSGCTALVSVNFGACVYTIGRGAFADCVSLAAVTLPASVWEVGAWAFAGCDSLQELTVDEDNPYYYSAGNCLIKTADGTLIAGCRTSVIPDDGSVTVIGQAAFADCRNLSAITIPAGVTELVDGAFSGCSRLVSVTLPDSVVRVADDAFGDCPALGCRNEGNARYLGNGQNPYRVLIRVDDPEAASCVIHPDTVLIADSAFAGSLITSVTIPEGVRWIGGAAFSDCLSLVSVTLPDSLEQIGGFCFDGSPLLEFRTEENACYLGNAENPHLVLVRGESWNASRLTIHRDTKLIAGGAFLGNALESVDIPAGVRFIGQGAFATSMKLTEISIPGTVKVIGDGAFERCPYLQSVTLEEGICEIGLRAFRGATALTSVSIPDSVVRIGRSAFAGCRTLESVTIGAGVREIGAWAFAGCERLQSVTFACGDGWFRGGAQVDVGNPAANAQMLAVPVRINDHPVPLIRRGG